jgi:hypothetical protein
VDCTGPIFKISNAANAVLKRAAKAIYSKIHKADLSRDDRDSSVEWELILDTRAALSKPNRPVAMRGGETFEIEARSLALFRLRTMEGRRFPYSD